MNMNPFPRGFEHATERNPLPRWARWLAAVLIVGGLSILEAHDAEIEAAIAATPAQTAVAEVRP